MKTITIKYPIDILLCLLYSILLIFLILFDINDILRMVIGLPFLLFIPGYLFLLSIAPDKSAKSEIDAIHKIAISIGLSIALVSLDGILLFYTPLGFSLMSIIFSLVLIVIVCGIVAMYRRRKLPRQNQFVLSLNVPTFESKSKLDKILFFILILAIMLTIFTVVFISFLPIKQESFTEFYILGASGKTIQYPKNLTRGQPSNVTIGLINQEHKTVDYTIEIWLINQTLSYDNSTKTMNSTYHEMLFLDKLTVTLNDFTPGTNIIWQPQWEYVYNFRVNKTGRYTLMFLLFTSPAPEYNTFQNYKDIAATEIQSAYESIYIWLNIRK
jgi:uncharacterized membrane protein